MDDKLEMFLSVLVDFVLEVKNSENTNQRVKNEAHAVLDAWAKLKYGEGL